MAPFLADHPVVSRHWRCRWVGWSAASNSVSWMLTWGWRELGCVLTPCSSSPQLWSAAFIFGNADLQMVKLVGIPLPEVHLVRVSDVGRNTHFYPLQLTYIPYYTAPTSFVENPFRWVIPSVIRTCQAEEGSYPDLPARAQGLDGEGAWLLAARGEALPLSCWPSWRLASSQTNTKAASWALWEHPYLCGMPISCSSPVTSEAAGSQVLPRMPHLSSPTLISFADLTSSFDWWGERCPSRLRNMWPSMWAVCAGWGCRAWARRGRPPRRWGEGARPSPGSRRAWLCNACSVWHRSVGRHVACNAPGPEIQLDCAERSWVCMR